MFDIKQWRNLQDDITTDSLWLSNTSTKNRPLFILPKRNWNFKNDSGFHGLFIPEIPYQFINRFTKSIDDIVWDPFYGSGTTKRVAEYLGFKNGIYSDLNPIHNDIQKRDIVEYLDLDPIDATIAFCHPPYHDIVKYSDNKNDLSNCDSIEQFLEKMDIVSKCYQIHVKSNGYVILVIGNLYSGGEEHTLGVWTKDVFRKNGFICKSHIIKDYGETKGTEGKNYNLNYVRQLRGGYNNFYGDNIFVLKRKEK